MRTVVSGRCSAVSVLLGLADPIARLPSRAANPFIDEADNGLPRHTLMFMLEHRANGTFTQFGETIGFDVQNSKILHVKVFPKYVQDYLKRFDF